MTNNRVVIYSNGIAEFRRCYRVTKEQPCEVSLAVRRDHLGDVLGSFNVYGDVFLDQPPTFAPANDLAGSLHLEPHEVYEQFAEKLSGANVEIEFAGTVHSGRLLGIDKEQQATTAEPISVSSFVVLSEAGMCRFPIPGVQRIEFVDPAIRKEIDKATQRNFERIKPNSTFVQLGMTTKEAECEAIVQYAIPAAAWKMSYRLRIDQQDDSRRVDLQGFAVVDNNTEEDWEQFVVSVVNGEPITFSTDLASAKTPQRKHVNLVSEQALGAIVLEAGAELSESDRRSLSIGSMDTGSPEPPAGGLRMRKRARAATASAVKPEAFDSAEVTEVGDFFVFEAESPVDIPSQNSTVIPMFLTGLGESKTVLHYLFENHPDRAFRSIEFRNECDHGLARGVCTVYELGNYAGSCILPALKPGEQRLLAHALDTSVIVQRKEKRSRNSLIAITISDGVCYTRNKVVAGCDYQITNNGKRSERLYLDHHRLMHQTL